MPLALAVSHVGDVPDLLGSEAKAERFIPFAAVRGASRGLAGKAAQ